MMNADISTISLERVSKVDIKQKIQTEDEMQSEDYNTDLTSKKKKIKSNTLRICSWLRESRRATRQYRHQEIVVSIKLQIVKYLHTKDN